MIKRRIATVSVHLLHLLQVLNGQCAIKLPSDIPSNSIFLYSFVEHDNQVLKIALSHEKFDEVTEQGFIKNYPVLITDIYVPSINPLVGPQYEKESLTLGADWYRDI